MPLNLFTLDLFQAAFLGFIIVAAFLFTMRALWRSVRKRLIPFMKKMLEPRARPLLKVVPSRLNLADPHPDLAQVHYRFRELGI